MITLKRFLLLVCLTMCSIYKTESFTNNLMRTLESSITNISEQVRSTLIPRNLQIFRPNERNKHWPFANTQQPNQYVEPNENKQNHFNNKTLQYGTLNSKISSRNEQQIKSIHIIGNYSHVQDYGYKNDHQKTYIENQTHNISKQILSQHEESKIPSRERIQLEFENKPNSNPIRQNEENDVASQIQNEHDYKQINNNSQINLNKASPFLNISGTDDARSLANGGFENKQEEKEVTTSPHQLPPVDITNVTVGTRFIINAPEKECAQGKVLQNGHCRTAT